MANARNNFRRGAGVKRVLSEADKLRGQKANRAWHWFSESDPWTQRILEVEDDDLPNTLIECGRLVRLHISAPNSGPERRHPRRRRDTMIEFSRSLSNESYVCFDPDQQDERLYLVLSPKAEHELKRNFWDRNPLPAIALGDLAVVAGGRHGRRDYPQVDVKPLGVVKAIVYFTHKKGDENPGDKRSYYIHKMAEISGKFPIVGIDNRGRLWLAGGNYTSPTPGITD